MEEETDNPEKRVMQKNHSHQEDRQEVDNKLQRPFFLSLICIFIIIFYGLISLLFLAALFSSGWITEVSNKYLTEGTESKQMIILIIAAGFLLHLVSFIGCIKIWYMRKSGFLMFSISSLIIALSQLFFVKISVFTIGVYICFILIFGFYYRRFD
jgi:hypothetical protein